MQCGHGEPALAVAVIGMSAGGLYCLKAIMQALPAELPGAIVIAYHVAAPSILPELISRWTCHVPRLAAPGETLQSGAIYVSPAERHIVINPDATLGVLRRERVRFVRPSIDWLFESAAGSFGERVVGVILSGANGDGSYGARCLSRAGGKVIVQEPGSCEYPAMPSAAIATGIPHSMLHPCEIGPALVRELSRMERESLGSWHPFGDDLLEAASTAVP